ncbi:MAG: CHAT domain-containing protein [Acidobacteria bacterium]|nr:CHAT domain-containing protein [Acidobacteriota bacterium]
MDAETLAALIDGRLEPRERAAVEAHLAECADCYEVWMDGVQLSATLGTPAPVQAPRPVGFSARAARAGAVAAAVALLALTAYTFWPRGQRPEIASLVVAVATARPIEARLSGGFAWGPVPSVTRSGAQAQPASAVQIAAGELQQKLERSRTAKTLAAFASGQAVLASPQSLDEAIRALKEATALAPSNGSYWSDLAAVHFARYQLSGDPLDLPESQEAVELALVQAPDLAEARFNRALILERLGLLEEALQAWRVYLAVDSSSPWAAEASKHIEALARRADKVSDAPGPSAIRDKLFDSVMPSWAAAPDSKARTTALAEANDIVASLATYPDALAREVVRTVTGASPTAVDRLRAGHTAYARARKYYLANRYGDAAKEFSVASQALSAADSPLAHAANTSIAVAQYLSGRVAEAEYRLKIIRGQLQDRGYPSLLGKVDWMLGVIALIGGDYRSSESYYEQAAGFFEGVGEIDNWAFMQVLLGERFDRAGDVTRAWEKRIQALPITRRSGALLEAARAARASGFIRTALMLETGAADRARSASKPLDLADALRQLAMSLAVAGRHDESRSRLREAASILASDDPSWNRMRAEVDLAIAWSTDAAHFQEGLEASKRSLQYFFNADAVGRLPEVHLAKARLLQMSGDVQAARIELDRGIALLDEQLETVTEPQLRATFQNLLARFGDETILLEVKAGRYDRAWEAAEQSRAWRANTASQRTAARLQITEVQGQLPPRAATLYFAVADEETFVWVLRKTTLSFASIRISRTEVGRLVEAFTISTGSESVGRELWHRLMEPVSSSLDGVDDLVVVPDGPLHLLPFAALPGGHSRFLIEEHSVLVAPNVAVALRRRTAIRRAETVLAIGNPDNARTAYPFLPDLPGANLEARMVADAFGAESQLLTGSEATAERVMPALANARVIHFASHALVNRVEPGQSALVLAGDSTITADEIAATSLVGTQLVVLAACESAKGRLTRSGPLGLANAFLRAGAHLVVAGYLAVDDRASLELFRRFYGHFRETENPAAALRRAQLALLRSGDPALNQPKHWATLGAFGEINYDATR